MNLTGTEKPSAGLAAVGIFLFFGSLMALLAGISLTWKGTALAPMWGLNPDAYQQLAPFGRLVGIPFLLLAALLAVAASGWFQHRLWAWRLTVVIIATQILGDAMNLLRGRFLEGATGVLIAGALLFYLLRPQTRAEFPRRERIVLDPQ